MNCGLFWWWGCYLARGGGPPHFPIHIQSTFNEFVAVTCRRNPETKELEPRECAYCGHVDSLEDKKLHCASFNKENYSPAFKFNTVDRVHSSRPYTFVDSKNRLINVVACCSACNFTKGNRDPHEFLAWLARICSRTTGQQVTPKLQVRTVHRMD